jgi:hypothetical protein
MEKRDGLLLPNASELCHVEGIQRLQAKYRWVDIADLHISLQGFEKGERFGNLGRNPNPPHTQSDAPHLTSGIGQMIPLKTSQSTTENLPIPVRIADEIEGTRFKHRIAEIHAIR